MEETITKVFKNFARLAGIMFLGGGVGRYYIGKDYIFPMLMAIINLQIYIALMYISDKEK